MGGNALNRVLTLDQWSRLGYLILKGSKHVSRNKEGVCQFSEVQVTKKSRRFLGYRGGDDPYEDENFYDVIDYDFMGEWGS